MNAASTRGKPTMSEVAPCGPHHDRAEEWRPAAQGNNAPLGWSSGFRCRFVSGTLRQWHPAQTNSEHQAAPIHFTNE